jgi:hypothetical protein
LDAGLQDGQILGGDEDLDAARHAGLSSDEACALEGEDHVVDGRWGHAEVPLDVGFGGRPPMHTRVASMKARYWPCLGVKLGLCLPDI